MEFTSADLDRVTAMVDEINQTVAVLIDREMAEGRLPTVDTSEIEQRHHLGRMYTELWYDGACVLSWQVVVEDRGVRLVVARCAQLPLVQWRVPEMEVGCDGGA
jgi:hypothetical protein